MNDHPAPCRTITLAEWQSRHLDGVVLGPDDRRLADSLGAGGEGRIGLDELRTGLRVSARSWVGVVRFSGVELRIIPKLVGGDSGLLKLVDYASGLDALDRHPAVNTFEAEGASLLDLVALLLAEACEGIARSGLLADYCEVEDDLPVVRGRLLLRRQMLTRFGRVDRVECRFDEHTTDITENRILLAALSVAGRRVSHPSVALRIRRLLGVFSEACALEDFDMRLARVGITYNRLNEHYRDAHELAWLLLDGLGIDDLYAAGDFRTFAFLLDMNRLFEDFITRWLAWLVKGTTLRVHPQRRDRTILWNADLAKPYTQVIPDLLVERSTSPGRFLPLDAKYKLYDQKAVSPADIYQNFLYAYAYGHHHATLPTALILYPASFETTAGLRLHVRQAMGQPGAELGCFGVHVPTALLEVKCGEVGQQGKALMGRIEGCLG